MSEPEDKRLPLEAIAHYCKWSRVFIERYWQMHGKTISVDFDVPGEFSERARSYEGNLIAALNRVSVKAMECADRPEKFAIFCKEASSTVALALSGGLVLARALRECHPNFPQGDIESDNVDPEVKLFTKANLEKLENGLTASLWSIRTLIAEHTKPQKLKVFPNNSYQGNAILAFNRKLGEMVGQDGGSEKDARYVGLDMKNKVKGILINAHQGGQHPRINQASQTNLPLH